ncbi:MAG: ATP-binding protein [Myxococcales bacterium]|nr:ATP-binding protein [Myxococcales bacterium]
MSQNLESLDSAQETTGSNDLAPFIDGVEHLQCEMAYARLLLRRHVERAGQGASRGGFAVGKDELDDFVAGKSWTGHAEADAFLAQADAVIQSRAQLSAEAGVDLPLYRIGEALALQATERDALRALLAPEVDASFERAYSAAWDDLSRKTMDIGFVVDLVAHEQRHRLEVTSMLGPSGTLVRAGVVELGPMSGVANGGLQGRAVRLAQRVALAVLGDAACDERLPTNSELRIAKAQLQDFLAEDSERAALVSEIQTALQSTVARVALCGEHGSGRTVITEIAIRAMHPGMRLLKVPVAADLDAQALHSLLAGVRLEALVSRAVAVLCLSQLPSPTWLAQVHVVLADLGSPVVLHIDTAQARHFGDWRTVLVPAPSAHTRGQLWQRALGRHQPSDPLLVPELARRFPLNGGGIVRAVRQARVANPQPQKADLWRAAQANQAQLLGETATPLDTTLSWSDMVLPAEIQERLEEVTRFSRGRQKVMNDWGFSQRLPYGRGVGVLLYGPSGTGKTMVAGLLAAELGLQLYRVDLSRMVSKWVGETERNLGKLFDEAQGQRAILLFDEADSLFAKRTEVKSSNDRYANLEVNYLLQRMEEFDGISILTTNLEAGIDEAFKRRLRFRICFPFPDAAARALMWRKMLPAQAAVAEGIDFEDLGQQFELPGAQIMNAILRAAFAVASRGQCITETDLRYAALQTCRDLGQPVRG